MNKFFFALTLVSSFAIPVNAGQILPNLYAEKFCQYRALGISYDDSINAAINEAYISSGKATKVKFQEKMIDSDIIDSAIAVAKKCPQFMK